MARSLFPAERRFTEPPSLADIESIAHEAYGTIPEELLRHVGDVVIHIEDFPDAETEQEMGLESPFDLLGLYRGAVEGRILHEPRGSGGFGYDPLFYCPAFGCTFGEATAEQKFAVSHRGQALHALLARCRSCTWKPET